MSETPQKTNYRSWLSKELLRRIEDNPAYSLRRFARQLDLSPATLSGVLSGKRRLSLKTASLVVEKLALSPTDANRFLQWVVDAEIGKGRESSVHEAAEALRLSEESFQVISEWYHYAILELTYLPTCKSEPRWFAQKLGISITEATQALDRLIELGLLERKNTRLHKTSVKLRSPDGVVSTAVRHRHKQVLQKAMASLEHHSIDERDITSMTMSINPELLPEAKRRIAEFRRELCAFLESAGHQRVYEFSLCLFPLSTEEAKSSPKKEGRKYEKEI